jgi:nucleoside-diphosphate-sugar epimerase
MADIFLTGMTGFVGGHVAAGLVAAGHRIRALTRGDRDRIDGASAVTPVEGSLHDLDLLAAEAGRADAVVHCAASDAPAFQAVNAAAIAAIMAALGPEGRFVTHGGTLTFGPTPNAPPGADGSAPYAPLPFLIARAEIERMILQAGHDGTCRTAIVHAALAYGGPGAMIPSTMVRAARESGVSAYPGTGEARWSAVHVDDWAGMLVAAVDRMPPGGTAYVAGGRPWSIAEVAAAIGALFALPVKSTPEAEAAMRWGMLGPALSVPQVFSAERAIRDLGVPPPRDGLLLALEAYGDR